jgi:integrase/recombinase XerD
LRGSAWFVSPLRAEPDLRNGGVVSLKNAYHRFCRHNEARNLAAKTHRFYVQQIMPFVTWCERRGITRADAVTAPVVGDYLAVRRRDGLGDVSIQAAYRALRALFNFCEREAIINVSPVKTMRMPASQKKVLAALSREDIATLLKACQCARDKALILMLLDTGIRASEAIALTGSDVDLEARHIHIRLGKGRKGRHAYIEEPTVRALAAYYATRGIPGSDERIWLSTSSKTPLSQSGLNQMLRKLGRRAGVANTNPHAFRRTFAVMALENGIDLYTLAKLLVRLQRSASVM